MRIFDKLKSQALNSISDLANNLQEKLDEAKRNLDDLLLSIQSKSKVETPLSSSQSAKLAESKESAQKDLEGGIYGEEIESLIEMALVDGEITEKEKQILFKKASSMGIDLDEFEMVLEAKLYEKKKAMNISSNTSQTTLKSEENIKANNSSGDSNVVDPKTVLSGHEKELDSSSPLSVLDKYPSKLKTIIYMEISRNENSDCLLGYQKQALLDAAQKYPYVDTFQLLTDAESLKKQFYKDYREQRLCKIFASPNSYFTNTIENCIMEAKLNFSDNPKVMNAVALAEIVLRERKKEEEKEEEKEED